jgi:NTP pyrophosphatase (non-canonical NTP hydrolase)
MSDELTFSDYQSKAGENAIYPRETPLQYLALGAAGEAGEIADKVKKKERDDKIDEEDLAKEIGDVLWYLSQLAEELEVSFGDIAEQNLDKICDRDERDKISGSGDNR